MRSRLESSGAIWSRQESIGVEIVRVEVVRIRRRLVSSGVEVGAIRSHSENHRESKSSGVGVIRIRSRSHPETEWEPSRFGVVRSHQESEWKSSGVEISPDELDEWWELGIGPTQIRDRNLFRRRFRC